MHPWYKLWTSTTHLFLWRESAPEYALPWNMLYWKGVPLMRARVAKKWTSPQSFMVKLFYSCRIQSVSGEGLWCSDQWRHCSPEQAPSHSEEWMWRFGSPSNTDRWLFSAPQIIHKPKLTSSNTVSEDYIISGGLNLDNDCLCFTVIIPCVKCARLSVSVWSACLDYWN